MDGLNIDSFVKNNICYSCVVISIAKADIGTSSSVIYARKLDKDFGGEGLPFQLSRFKNCNSIFWENQEITKQNLEVGSIATYVQLGNEFFYVGKTKHRRQVSWPSLVRRPLEAVEGKPPCLFSHHVSLMQITCKWVLRNFHCAFIKSKLLYEVNKLVKLSRNFLKLTFQMLFWRRYFYLLLRRVDFPGNSCTLKRSENHHGGLLRIWSILKV